MHTYFYGIYGLVLGFFCRLACREAVATIDKMNEKHHPERIVGNGINKVFSLESYSEIVNVKINGYKSLHQYYELSNLESKMHKITIPTFFLAANDDIMMGPYMMPTEKIKDNFLVGVTKAGGHLGYFEGLVVPTG